MRLLKPESFDLIVLDLMLPGATGEELIGEIRQESTVPILVVSAKGQADKLHVLRSGADDFVSKPFDVEEVRARAECLLRRSREFSVRIEKGRCLTLGKLIMRIFFPPEWSRNWNLLRIFRRYGQIARGCGGFSKT